MSAPLYRAEHYDKDDMEVGFDHSTGGTIRSAEMVRKDRVIKAALRMRLFAKSDKQAMRQMRGHIESLNMPMYRLVRLNELACVERWPPEAWGPPEPAHEPMPGHGCTHGQWREAAFLVHRATLSLLLEARPGSYADVHDQLRLVFYATPISLEEEQRRKLKGRLMGHVARLVAGLPFTEHPTH